MGLESHSEGERGLGGAPSAARWLPPADWNHTATDYPRDRCIHELFAEVAARSPEGVALTAGGHRLSYAELDRSANRLANYLRSRGVTNETVVGVHLDRSPEMIVALLAVLKAGGTYLPLDASYPRERLMYILADARASLVLTTSARLDDLPLGGVARLPVDGGAQAIAGQPDRPPDVTVGPMNLAYVMHTSGSTGQSKGAAITHRNVIRLVRSVNYVSIAADDVFLQLAPIAFDAAIFEIWGALLNGARLVLYPNRPLDFDVLARVIEDEGVTVAWFTAGIFHRLVDYRPAALRPLRSLLAGGDVLSPPHVWRLKQHLPNCELINGYGPTECTTFSVCWRVRDSAGITATVPIGRPVSNARLYILDDALEQVPVGEVGELYIGGEGVARGYFNRPALTAHRFVPNPHGPPGDRLYRSGDLARYCANGEVEFLGRVDRQVKVRGFRIEPGEVEASLMTHPDVGQAVTLALDDTLGDKRLVAYLVSRTGHEPEARALRVHLKRRLPPHMVPSTLMWLRSLPLTPNGKVDYRRLPRPEWSVGGCDG
jgi:aspartate racemase